MLKKISFKIKLLLLSLTLIFVSVSVGLLSERTLTQVFREYTWVVEKTSPQRTIASELYSEVRNYRLYLRTLQTSKPEKSKAVIEKLTTVQTDYENIAKKYTSLGLSGEQKLIYEEADSQWKKMQQFGTKVIELYQSNQLEQLEAHFASENSLASEYRDSIKKLIKFHEDDLLEKVTSAKKSAESGTSMNIILILLGSMFSLVVGYLFANSISKVLGNISNKLRNGAEEINSTSKKIAKSSSDLSSATQEQAASLQETASSVNEISSMVQRNSDNAEDSRKIAVKSNDAANRGQDVVSSMISAMDEINQSSSEIVQQTEESNREISEIINVINEIENKTKVINEIVFQTKLLSFNASVEAARAGEHGKGFAVVAEEVGSLAQMSGNAAEEISNLLAGSVQKVNTIVNNSKEKIERLVSTSKDRVEMGMNTAKLCGDVLSEIVQSVSELSIRINEITSASKEQSQGVQEISNAMVQLDQVTQQNAAAASEASTAGANLEQQAFVIRQLIVLLQDVINGENEANSSSLQNNSNLE